MTADAATSVDQSVSTIIGSARAEDDEAQPPPPAPCTAAGYFPHPTDCQKFRLCADKDGEYVEYECPPRYVYDAVAEQCRYKWWPFDCKQVSCSAEEQDASKPFPGSSVLYAKCDNGLPIMFRCEDTENFVYNNDQKKCVRKCRSSGRLSDPDDCAAYYECSRRLLTLSIRHWKCVVGYSFSEEQQKCVRGGC